MDEIVFKDLYDTTSGEYFYDTPKKSVVLESSRKIIHAEIRGKTLVNRVIDKHYDGFKATDGRGTSVE